MSVCAIDAFYRAGHCTSKRLYDPFRVEVYRCGSVPVGGAALAASCCKNPEKGRTINRDQYEDSRERLRERMATEEGREIYKRRKFTVEPRFGHIKRNMGIRRFLRRGLEKVKTEWTMICTAVNLGILLRNWEKVLKVL